ncbi:MAG: outer membrane lipoprotein-sorting protein [Alcanivorax sp.]|nr:outer membrane lipoprotein-sorting protein [Alcanivorax sp.]
MRIRPRLIWLPFLAACLLLARPVAAMDADTLMRHIDRLWRGQTSHAVMTMTVTTRRYQRTLSLEAWSKGKAYSLIVIRQPIKDAGVTTLKVEDNIWNYLPKINRVTKVPSSMMAGSWMGSHFTNDDLVRESTFEDDYHSQISFQGERDGQRIYEITSIPNADAAVVWGKVVMIIDQQTLAPYKAWYYDEEGALVRTLVFDQRQRIGERTVPMRLSLQPQDKPDESTVITYQSIEFDRPLDDGFFSLKNLKRQ